MQNLAWIADADGYIYWYNRRWFDYTGTTLADMEGWGWESVHDLTELPRVKTLWQHSINTGKPFEMTFPLRGVDGVYRPFLTHCVPDLDEAGRVMHWFGTNTDLSVIKRAEEALLTTEKLAIVGRLASSIAHEINNPLEAVTNLLYLARGTKTLDEAKTLIAAAEDELSRVTHITAQTLRFHRDRTMAAPHDLGETLDSVLALYRGRLRQGEVNASCEKIGDLSILGHAGELRQVLANLVANAIDAMPRGGTVRLRARQVIENGGSSKGIRVLVSDSGVGVDEETRARIFEPFFTTKSGTGTGLGLWVSQEIVSKHGGSLRIRSCVAGTRRGTTFAIFIPKSM